jgi:AraC-like DNA-binding protein
VPRSEHDAIKRWSTADVPQAKRVDYFAASLSEAVIPFSVDNADPGTFRAELSCAQVDAISVCKTVGSRHRSFRERGELARTGEDSVHLLMTLQTSWTANHHGPMRLLPCDILIYDSMSPVETDIRSAFTAIAVGVTAAWLRHWIPDTAVLAPGHVPGNSPWGRALSTYLSELSPDLVAAPPLPLSVIADQVGSLLALTASSLRSAPPLTPAQRSMHERILDCIAQRCMESQLTAGDIASSMGISVRTLHRIFAASNETFGGKLNETRAHVALRMLTSPLYNRLTTAEIGRRAGFISSSHFARVLRNRTGSTPLQLRRQDQSDAARREGDKSGRES